MPHVGFTPSDRDAVLPETTRCALSRKDDGLSAAISVTPRSRSEADFLNHEIAGETVCRLDNDGADTVAGDAGKQRSKAGSRLDRIGTAHRGIVETIDDYYRGRLGIAFDCLPLPCLTVLSVTHIGSGRTGLAG